MPVHANASIQRMATTSIRNLSRMSSMAVILNGGVTENKANQDQANRLSKVLENLRKQHLWGDISDGDYRREKADLERQIKTLTPDTTPIEMPNMERAAQLLNEMPALWQHPGVTNKQRESLVQEVFNKISIDGDALVTVEPKPEYAPLFAEMLTHTLNGYREFDSPPSPPNHTILPSGIIVMGIDSWVARFEMSFEKTSIYFTT